MEAFTKQKRDSGTSCRTATCLLNGQCTLIGLQHESCFSSPRYMRQSMLCKQFFSVRRLLGFRQVVAQVRLCNKRIVQKHAKPPHWEHQKRAGGPLRSPVSVHVRCQATQPRNKRNHHKTQSQNNKNQQQKTQQRKQENIVMLDSNALCKLKQQLVCWNERGPSSKASKNKNKHSHKLARGRCKNNTSRCGNPGSPQPGSRKSQRDAHRAQQAPSSQWDRAMQANELKGWEHQQQAPCRGVAVQTIGNWDMVWNMN